MSIRLRTALAVCGFAAALPAQGLVVSVAQDVAVPGGFALQEELHRLDGGGRRVEWPLELLAVLTGDSDGDGLFDDAPSDLDAAHFAGGAGHEAWLLSCTANFTAAGGVQVLDGDVFRFTATGVQIVYAESFFQNATGTTAIDVDAFAVGPLGELYFSFAEDETTSNAALIAQNGGAPLLDEQCVFRLDAGAATAVLHLTPAQALSVFNAACSATATTLIDVDGVEVDPFHPGHLLLTCASSAAALRGRVVSTFGGGQIFFVGGIEAGPVGFDFATPTSLDALAWTPNPYTPVLRIAQQHVSVATSTMQTITVGGLLPGEIVRFAVTDALMPRPLCTTWPGAGGFGSTALDVTSPLLAFSLGLPALERTADAFGQATFQFSVAGLPANVYAAVQAIVPATGVFSTPTVAAFLP
jgi:hypothetical protein